MKKQKKLGLALALALVVGLEALASAGPADAAVKTHCRDVGGKVELRAASLVVRSIRVRSGRRYFACLGPSGRAFPLGVEARFNDRPSPRLLAIRAAGTFVAYQYIACQSGNCEGSIRVKNLRSGKTQEVNFGGTRVSDLGVNKRGDVAWTERPRGGVAIVRKRDSNGEDTVAEGSIELRSLSVRGSFVSWRQDGAGRSFRLNGTVPCGERGSVGVLNGVAGRIDYNGRGTFGCLARTGKRVPLFAGTPYSDGGGSAGLQGAQIQETFAAAALTSSGKSGSGALVVVVNLESGQPVHEFSGVDGYVRGETALDPEFEPAGISVDDLVLAPSGGAAWIARIARQRRDGLGFPGPPEARVYKSDAEGENVLLDRGADIPSLALSGSTLSWTSGGEQKSAVLR